jgi:hypothetical protein
LAAKKHSAVLMFQISNPRLHFGICIDNLGAFNFFGVHIGNRCKEMFIKRDSKRNFVFDKIVSDVIGIIG